MSNAAVNPGFCPRCLKPLRYCVCVPCQLCGHGEEHHGTDQEVDADSRALGPEYLVCFSCLALDTQAGVWSHDFDDGSALLADFGHDEGIGLAREKVELLGYLSAIEEWMLGDLGSASGCCASTEHPDDLCAGHEVLRLVHKGLALGTSLSLQGERLLAAEAEVARLRAVAEQIVWTFHHDSRPIGNVARLMLWIAKTAIAPSPASPASFCECGAPDESPEQHPHHGTHSYVPVAQDDEVQG